MDEVTAKWINMREQKIKQQAAEIKRLREALKEIDALPHQKRGSVSYAMAAIARSALQQKETG